MIWHQEEHRDLFWVGFLAGITVGGTLGVLLATEAGRRACEQVESVIQEARNRLNGRTDAPGQEQPEAEADVENPT